MKATTRKNFEYCGTQKGERKMKVRFKTEKIWGRVRKDIFIIPTIQVSFNGCFCLCDNLQIKIWFLIFGLTVNFMFEGKSYV